jgi:signal transduction histidine kinase
MVDTVLPEENALQSATIEVYAQSREIAKKNKTLSLLTSLYSIGTQKAEIYELCASLCEHIAHEYEFEHVALLRYTVKTDTLRVLASTESARCSESHQSMPRAFNDVSITDASKQPFISIVCMQKGVVSTIHPDEVWGTSVPAEVTAGLHMFGHVQAYILCPLYVGDGLLALLVLGSNRAWDKLMPYERASLETLSSVVTTLVDRAVLYEQLVATNKELAYISAQKSAFLSFASHQLRTPLQSITGYLNILHENLLGALPDKAHDVVTNILSSSSLMSKTIDDFLDASKIEQGVMQYVKEVIDMNALVHDVVFEQTIQARKKGIELLEVPSQQPCPVYIDKAKLKHVVVNLIDNAIKYTKAGSVTTHVQYVAEQNRVRVLIVDTGIGVAPEDIPKLFEKFTRGKTAKDQKIAGTGVGLYIAKEMVEAQGGTISLYSQGIGAGSTFTVEFPQSGTTEQTHKVEGAQKLAVASSM